MQRQADAIWPQTVELILAYFMGHLDGPTFRQGIDLFEISHGEADRSAVFHEAVRGMRTRGYSWEDIAAFKNVVLPYWRLID